MWVCYRAWQLYSAGELVGDIEGWSIIGALLGANLLGWLALRLRHADLAPHFAVNLPNKYLERGWLKCVFWVLLMISTLVGAENYVMQKRLDTIRPINIEVAALDAETGKPLKSMTTPGSNPEFDKWGVAKESFSYWNGTSSYKHPSGDMGVALDFRARAWEPITLYVGSDGYERGEITVNPGDSGRREVMLRRAVPAAR